jgi:hypothetical protein
MSTLVIDVDEKRGGHVLVVGRVEHESLVTASMEKTPTYIYKCINLMSES